MLERYAEQYKKELFESVVPFWLEHSLDQENKRNSDPQENRCEIDLVYDNTRSTKQHREICPTKRRSGRLQQSCNGGYKQVPGNPRKRPS